MDKKYIGVAGQILSGKGTAAEYYLTKHDGLHLRFSKVLDEILNILDLPLTRLNEQKMGVVVKEMYGEEVLSNALVDRAMKSEKNLVVFEGLRKVEELQAFKKDLPNFKLIYIKASPEIRYDRMTKRNEKLGESQKSYEEFLESEKHEADKRITELQDVADFVVSNEGSQVDFEQQLEKILTEKL